jgi:small ligand-binding sensory domain FIST
LAAQFPFGHATHPQWRMAAGLVLAQLRAQMALHGYATNPTLAIVYITDHYAPDAQDILDHLSAELPSVPDWSGTVGVGIASNNVEYFDVPALAVMLCELPTDQYRVFSGVAPLASHRGLFDAHTALVHADASTPDVAELLHELAERVDSGYLFGGLAASRQGTVQFAVSGNGNVKGQGHASGVFQGGLSGVAFSEGVRLVSRVTQGCEPMASLAGHKALARTVTAAQDNVIIELDGESALDVLLDDLGISLEQPQAALDKLRGTLVGITDAGSTALGAQGQFGADTRVRHIIGLDPMRRGIAIAERAQVGASLVFCTRHMQAARRDLVRICAEIREELEPAELDTQSATNSVAAYADTTWTSKQNHNQTILGAIYVSCAGRGGAHFGAPSAELQIIRHALGDVPLVGFFAGGEIAHRHLYSYTGVLSVFVA